MSKIKAVVIHRTDQNNVGDMASNPLQYFLNQEEYQVVDVAHVGQSAFPDELPVIYGGGGLFGNEHFGDNIKYMLGSPDVAQIEDCWDHRWHLQNPKNKEAYNKFYNTLKTAVEEAKEAIPKSTAPRITWGTGHNTQGEQTGKRYPKELRSFDLVGIRDWWSEEWQDLYPDWDWTPCASCMHPGFRKKYTATNDIIVFEHKKQLIKSTDFGSKPIPRFVNSGNNMQQTIELLGSAHAVITNSYHGAYWATLLGKKVLIVNPWSSKFYGFKHNVEMRTTKGGDWIEALDEAEIHTDALDECITATETFWNKVKGVL